VAFGPAGPEDGPGERLGAARPRPGLRADRCGQIHRLAAAAQPYASGVRPTRSRARRIASSWRRRRTARADQPRLATV